MDRDTTLDISKAVIVLNKCGLGYIQRISETFKKHYHGPWPTAENLVDSSQTPSDIFPLILTACIAIKTLECIQGVNAIKEHLLGVMQ